MKIIIFISLFFFLNNCSKPKTVMICGDHICINKAEAEQYFEDNLHKDDGIKNDFIDINRLFFRIPYTLKKTKNNLLLSVKLP